MDHFEKAMTVAEHYQNMIKVIIDMCVAMPDDSPDVADFKRTIIEFLHSAFQDRRRMN